jgi:hypothetical protein
MFSVSGVSSLAVSFGLFDPFFLALAIFTLYYTFRYPWEMSVTVIFSICIHNHKLKPAGWIFTEFNTLKFHKNLHSHFNFHVEQEVLMVNLHEDLLAFLDS